MGSHRSQEEMKFLKRLAIRLRSEERMSITEIQKITKLSKGTLGPLLVEHPLLDDERRDRRHNHGVTPSPLKADIGGPSKHSQSATSDLSKEDKAHIAEAAVLFRLALHGFEVFDSVFEGSKADWLVRAKDGKLLTVQVKWAAHTDNGRPKIKLKHGNGRSNPVRYKAGSFDIICGYCLFNDTAYVYTEGELKDHKATKSVEDSAAEAWKKLN